MASQALGAVLEAGPQVLGGLMKMGQGIFGSRRRRREQRAARQQYESNYSRFMGLDTSNPYKNMENTYEDLTVNRMQADYATGKATQGLANTLDTFKSAAGGSGIAGLASMISEQQFSNMMEGAATIGLQESGNEMAAANMAGQIQNLGRQGEVLSREMEAEKTGTLLGMSQQRLAAANAARQQATQNLMGGITDVVSAGAEAAGSMLRI